MGSLYGSTGHGDNLGPIPNRGLIRGNKRTPLAPPCPRGLAVTESVWVIDRHAKTVLEVSTVVQPAEQPGAHRALRPSSALPPRTEQVLTKRSEVTSDVFPATASRKVPLTWGGVGRGTAV